LAKVLVTGGCGFIGSHVVDELLNRDHDVVIVDNLSTGKLENILQRAKDVELRECDIRDSGAVKEAMRGVDVVFHEAALGSVPGSIADPTTTHEVNVTGTLNVLTAARDAGSKRVVFASSSSIYGDTPDLPKIESMRPMPLSPYAVSKLAGEAYMYAFARAYGIETISLRYFNVFGPRQDPASKYAAVIPKFIETLMHGDTPMIYGDGTQTRDFTYVDNVVMANMLAMDTPGVSGDAVNIGGNRQISLNELLAMLAGLIGVGPKPEYGPAREGDVKHSYADCTAANRLLKYEPRTSVEEGLRRTVEWFAVCRQ